MIQQKGSISIHTENIFPIIKKSLYSDTEIFIRELASNGVDACQKLKLSGPVLGAQFDPAELAVTVTVDAEAKTITFSDNGIGMTADEVEKYINQIAFSGATEFVEKFKDSNLKREDIIGNFGLGFYSSFMVSDKVEIFTKSYQEDAPAIHWICDGSTEYTIEEADKTTRGTDVVLHLAADSEEFADETRVKDVLRKYCRFLPINVKFGEEDLHEDPLWTRKPQDLTDEDYKSFYSQLYPMAEEPSFWIHLNVDHPFTLTGILYFPKVGNRFELEREKIQLYSRQVFITEQVKGIVPDFLMLLHGVIDSPDIPLNVSRSYLQTDTAVRKISQYIVRKVADKLADIFAQDRSGFEEKWDNVGFFVKYGMISEPKFAEKAKAFTLLESLDKKLYTLEEYKEKTAPLQTDKDGKLNWLYTQNADQQAAFIAPLQERGYDVLTLIHPIDPHFIGHLEQAVDGGVSIKRVDTDSPDKIIQKDTVEASALSKEQEEQVLALFKSSLGEGSKYQVEGQPLLSTDMPVSLVKNEWMQRMEEMAKTQGSPNMMFGMGDMGQLIINYNHPAIARLTEGGESQATSAQYLIDLALLAQGKLSGPALTEFLRRSASLV